MEQNRAACNPLWSCIFLYVSSDAFVDADGEIVTVVTQDVFRSAFAASPNNLPDSLRRCEIAIG